MTLFHARRRGALCAFAVAAAPAWGETIALDTTGMPAVQQVTISTPSVHPTRQRPGAPRSYASPARVMGTAYAPQGGSQLSVMVVNARNRATVDNYRIRTNASYAPTSHG